MSRKTLFVDLLLPLPLRGTFTYRVPFVLNNHVQKGKRVVVQFGKKKIYSAIIKNIHNEVPDFKDIKYVLEVIDDKPIVTQTQLKFWEWISRYYMAHEGSVMNAALPSSLKIASETKIVLNPDAEINTDNLTDDEYLVFEALNANNILNLTEVSNILDRQKVLPLIKTMIEKKLVLSEEDYKSSYKPKIETYVKISKEYRDEDKLRELLNEKEKKAEKQFDLLMTYLHLSAFFSKELKEISRPALIQKASSNHATLNALVKQKVFDLYEKQHSRLIDFESVKSVESIELNQEQQDVLNKAKESLKQKNVFLIHGVTGSGKTEIYIKLIDEVIKRGEQVLFLLPEIALTSQLINRLRQYFGKKVGVYHSRYNMQERAEVWRRTLGKGIEGEEQYQILLGARSAIFLPFDNLGLVVVDEEHDSSYKQFNPEPRYNARDSAIYLAKLHNAKTILGSATPSVESYNNAKNEKFGFGEIKKRFGGVLLPEIQVVDIKQSTRRKEMKSHFSDYLIENIRETLKKGEQVILFQNRRGFSLRVVCDKCGWTPECNNCDVSLTFHKYVGKIKCHYCGASQSVPTQCPDCGHHSLKMKGFGTEKVEDELPNFFPKASVKRMDLETTRSKNSFRNIINDFDDRKIDILVGTQMVTKGLDFDNVGLVGVMNADNLINFPDFRAFERSFQLLTQVSGRAGRKNKQGKVIIQTMQPYHNSIRYTMENDYQSMFLSQLGERRKFKYPPHYKLIKIELRHKDAKHLNRAADIFATMLRAKLGNRVLGPEYPLISRIKTYYIKSILIKFEAKASAKIVKEMIQNSIIEMEKNKDYRNIRIDIDVDPA